jgi:hypothetical protein
MVNKEHKKHHGHHVSSAKTFLYSGTIILFILLLFLVVNSGESDTALAFCVPFIMAVVALLIAARFVK